MESDDDSGMNTYPGWITTESQTKARDVLPETKRLIGRLSND